MPVYFVLCKRVYFNVDVPVQSDALIGVSQLLYITCGVGGGDNVLMYIMFVVC